MVTAAGPLQFDGWVDDDAVALLCVLLGRSVCAVVCVCVCVRVYDVIRCDPGVVGRAHELDEAPARWKPAVR